MLVHGSLQDHSISAALVAELRAGITTFAMDRRGFGASGDGADYTIEREFEDVAAVVDAVAARTGGPVAVWGHSYGASLAMGGATLTRNISHLVLYEPSLGLAYPEGWIETVEKALAAGDDEAAIVLVLRDVLEFTDDQMDAVRSSPEWARRVAVAPTVAREARAEAGVGVSARASSAGSRRRRCCCRARRARRLSSGPPTPLQQRSPAPGSHVLDGHAHIAHRTHPAMVAALVREFIASST